MSDNGRQGGCGQNGLHILNGWGSMFVRVLAWDLDGVTSSRDSRDMLQLGWQSPYKYLVGGFGRSAKAGWAAEGVISNCGGTGKRSGGLVLPSWGPKRVRADAWDLARVANSTNTRPARQSGQPLQSQKRLRWLASARPRGSKTAASHIREWHNSATIFNRDNVNDVVARSRSARTGQAM